MNPEDELIFLCNLFGACIKRSQGAGGNISVKHKNRLYIKASGVRLSSVNKESGYVVCDLSGTFHNFTKGQQDLQSTILVPTKQKPSMETFFHLLPQKYVVHIHPVFFCNLLCKANAKKIFSKKFFPNSLYIPYVKPGYELANEILSVYNDEDVIFLENHGIIILGESIEGLLELYMQTVQNLEILGVADKASPIQTEYLLLRLSKQSVKPIYSVSIPLPSCFSAITPDHFLFLQDRPLISTKESLEESFAEWLQVYSKNPSIVQVDTQIYVLGNSMEECQNKEEYLLSYFDIISPNSTVLPQKEKASLLQCPKEQFRLQTLKH